MQQKDIKILWGRSGNRCSICKLELTADGDKETLGEMAHIVAKSEGGPRGNSRLEISERDRYRNLILLCPTHHSEIDKNHGDWSVENLLQIKAEHEKWVSSQLAEGNISIATIDNAQFLVNRYNVWSRLFRNDVGVVVSLTPLRVTSRIIDSLKEKNIQYLKEATLPAGRMV